MSEPRGWTGGRDSTGQKRADSKPVNILVDGQGRQITVPGPFAQAESGLVRPRAAHDGTQIVGSRRGVWTPWAIIPGTTAVAYADEDAFGTKFTISDVPINGTVHSFICVDEDDENIDFELWCYSKDITSGTDNGAY